MKMIRESLLFPCTTVSARLLRDGTMGSQILRSLYLNQQKMMPMWKKCQKQRLHQQHLCPKQCLNQLHLNLPLRILLVLEQQDLHAEAPDCAVNQCLQLLTPRLYQMGLVKKIRTRTVEEA